MKKTYDQLTYVITHGLGDKIHFSKVDSGTTLSSGQPNMEEFTDEKIWKDRIAELGGDISKLNEDETRAARPQTPEARAALIAERRETRLASFADERRKGQTPEQRQANRLERQSNRAEHNSGRFGSSTPVITEAPAPAPVVTEAPAPVVTEAPAPAPQI